MNGNHANDAESEPFYDSWIFTTIMGVAGSAILVWLLVYNDKTLTYISLCSLFLFFAYVLVIPVHLSRKVATENEARFSTALECLAFFSHSSRGPL